MTNYAFNIYVRPSTHESVPEGLADPDVPGFILWMDMPDLDSETGYRRIMSYPTHEDVFKDDAADRFVISRALCMMAEAMIVPTEEEAEIALAAQEREHV
jgi:hypothetical protein